MGKLKLLLLAFLFVSCSNEIEIIPVFDYVYEVNINSVSNNEIYNFKKTYNVNRYKISEIEAQSFLYELNLDVYCDNPFVVTEYRTAKIIKRF